MGAEATEEKPEKEYTAQFWHKVLDRIISSNES
jgi:hypothetical protein